MNLPTFALMALNAALPAAPLPFEENRGQTSPAVRFLARGTGYTLYLTRNEAVFSLGGEPRAAVRLSLDGAEPGRCRGEGKLASTSSYFIGGDPARWVAGAPHYGRVVYEDVYPGIDLVFHGKDGAVEYDFLVASGADPGRIALRFEGADGIDVDARGDLLILAGGSTLRHEKPIVYEEGPRGREPVPGEYIRDKDVVRFLVARRNPALPLVIDPILVYSSLLGTPVTDSITDIEVDPFGSAYLTGFTTSPDFPVKAPLQPEPGLAGALTAFVTKLKPTGRDLVYSTYLGGTGFSRGEGITVEPDGTAVVAGTTDAADFPRRNPLRPGHGGGTDLFLTRLSPGGNQLLSSTLYGGSADEHALDVARDEAGSIYLTGDTSSANFPTVSPLDATLGGASDAFVIRVKPAGEPVIYATYLGGSGAETARGIAADAAGSAYVTGETRSSDFLIRGGVQGMLRGNSDAFVTKLSANGRNADYSTYLGGDGGDDGWGIALDAGRNAHVCGRASGGFPLKGTLFDPLGSQHLFTTKLQADGSDVVYSTLLGSNITGIPQGIAVSSTGDAYVCGWVAYFGDGFSNFPRRGPPLQEIYGGGSSDAFLLRIDSTGAFFRFASFLGGTQGEEAAGIALGQVEEVYIAGQTFGGGFPTTIGALDRTYAAQNDGFVSRIDTAAYPDDPPYLTLGVSQAVSLTLGDPQQRYRVIVPPGLRALITVTDGDPADANALYARYGFPAEPYAFDFRADGRGRPSQRLVIPETRVGECHLLVKAHVIGGASNAITIRADALDLVIERMAPGRSAAGSLVHAGIRGGGFDATTIFSLVSQEDGFVVIASSVTLLSSANVEAVFDLADATRGTYAIKAEEPGGDSAVLKGALEVVEAGLPGVLGLDLSVPDSTRVNRMARLTIEYENAGDDEIPAPLLEVTAPATVEMRVEGEETFVRESLAVLALNPSGPADWLPPGARGSIPIAFRTNLPGPVTFEVRVLTPNRGDFVGWDTLRAPAGYPAAEWNAIRANLSGILGASWLDYRLSLGRIAARRARLGLVGAPVVSVRELFRAAAMEADGSLPGAALAGQVIHSARNAPLRRVTLLAFAGSELRSSTVTDPYGRFALQCLEAGTTYQVKAEDFDTADSEVTLPADGSDVLGLEVRAALRFNTLNGSGSPCDAFTVPGGPIVPPKVLWTRLATRSVRIVSSSDPNEKDGPDGEGPQRVIGVNDEVLYTVRFENVRTATADAQLVVVTDQLDPDLDWSTFRLREFGVGDHVVSLDAVGSTGGSSGIQSSTAAGDAGGAGGAFAVSEGYSGDRLETDVRVTSRYRDVDVRCEFDPLTGSTRWTFQTIDPVTGGPPPLFVDDGFLPPNTQPPAGEGWVSFTIFPRTNLAEGVEIKNEGTIQFDDLAPMDTEPVTNLISHSLWTLRAPLSPFPASGLDHAVEVSGLYLGWEGDPRTISYDLLLWREGEPFPSRPTASGITSPFHVPERAVEHDTIYHWQVVANGPGGKLAKGSQWSFRTVEPDPKTPGIPRLTSPAPAATGVPLQPTLAWARAEGADVYDVFLWRHSDPRPALPVVAGIGSTSFALAAPLAAGTRYDWQVAAINRTGRTNSSVGTFTTAAPAQGVFQRGDINADRQRNISDPVFVLGYLFLGSPREIPCADAADVNDDGTVDISDPSSLLGYLFLGTATALPPPFQACGTDPTQDTLTCEGFLACE